MEIVRDIETWMRMAPEWNALLARSASSYPFLRCEFLRAWWDHRGGGEWPAADLRIAVWREAGALRGVAPLFRSVRNGEPRYFLIGSTEISDYLDLIAEPEGLSALCRSLLDEVGRLPGSEVEALDFFNLQSSSPTIPALEEEAARRGWVATREPLQACPVIALPKTWDGYLESLDKKTRHEIRRKMRRAEGGEENLELKILGAEGMDEFLRLMSLDEKKAAFLTPPMRDQFQAIGRAAQQAGMCQLAFLVRDGINIAAYLNFTYANRIWVYNSGMDPKYAAYSPGWILLALLIRRAIEEGYGEFDFMRGNEGYKFQWGGVARQITRLTIHR